MIAHCFAFIFVLFGQTAQPQASPTPQPAADPSQMSVAELAAASRKAHGGDPAGPGAPQLTPEQRGYVRGTQYINNFFHFQISQPSQWELYSAGRMNVSEAVGRAYLNLPGGIRGSSNRAFGMGDGTGRTVTLAIMQLPPNAPSDPAQLAAALKMVIFAQIPSAKESAEDVSLSDPEHKFAAFRYTFTVRDVSVMESVHLTTVNGFVVSFTTAAGSNERLSDALRILKTNLAWTAVKP
jgi:hypothetical protein